MFSHALCGHLIFQYQNNFYFFREILPVARNEVSDLSMLSSSCFILLFQSSKNMDSRAWTFAGDSLIQDPKIQDPRSRNQDPEIKIPKSRSRNQDPEIKIQNQDPEIKIQKSRSRNQDPEIKIPKSRSRNQDPEIKIQKSRSRNQDPEIKIPKSRSRNQDSEMCVLCLKARGSWLDFWILLLHIILYSFSLWLNFFF